MGSSRVTDAPEDLLVYSRDANVEVSGLPHMVAFPETNSEISTILKLANKYTVPITPRGAGSGFTGGAVPVCGGLVLAMDRFNKILEIDAENRLLVVEPGVVVKTIQDVADQIGLMYPPDPASASFSSIGGNIAENAGGIRAVKYGVTKNYVMGLEIVLPTGEIINTGSKCLKDVVGFNLTELFVGSEGTLGVITKAILKLVSKPQARRTMTATFMSMESASRAVRKIYASGVRPATLEFMDNFCIELVRKVAHFSASAGEGALLLIEFDGSNEAGLDHEAGLVEKACEDCDVITFRKAQDENEREELWAARRAISFAQYDYCDEWDDDDVAVPISRIPQLQGSIEELGRKHSVIVAFFGHYGDGNIHVGVTTGDKQRRVPREFKEELAVAVSRLEGRIAAEHGIGCLKTNRVHLCLDHATLRLMRRFKNLLDPNGILNPGKVLPEEIDNAI
ncbi:MAG: FAD-binding protein [Desulfovibrio sp.]|nr:FAD-binding protein [Desulfovibrio sp.]